MHVHDAYDTIVVFRVHTHGKCRLHHKLEFCQKGWVDLAGFFSTGSTGASFDISYSVLYGSSGIYKNKDTVSLARQRWMLLA